MIRQAKKLDIAENIDRIIEIYNIAKAFMRSKGNLMQWAGSYPAREDIVRDIEKGVLYLVEDSEISKIYAVFALIGGTDPTYHHIEGTWHYDEPYATIHRVATDGSRKKVFDEVVAFAKKNYQHLRIDTHEDNRPMQDAIIRNGFSYAGVIYLTNGDPRLAYDWRIS